MEVEEEKLISEKTSESFFAKPDSAELCRLCANTDNQLIPIFQGEGLEHNIPLKLNKHLPIIKITENDKLPLQVCYQCASTLIAWHNLYEGCTIADQRLREILNISEKNEDNDLYEDLSNEIRDDSDNETQNNNSVDDIPVNYSTISPHSEDNTEIIDNKSGENTADISENESLTRCMDGTMNKTNSEQASNDGGGLTRNAIEFKPEFNARLTDLFICNEKLNSLTTISTNDVDESMKNSDNECDDNLACIKQKSLRCNFCPMVFLRKKSIIDHLRASHIHVYGLNKNKIKKDQPVEKRLQTKNPPPLKLRIRNKKCVASSSPKHSVKKESAKVSGKCNNLQQLHQCKLCSKICLSAGGLTRHSAIHKNQKIVDCSYCNQKFTGNDEKVKHVSDYHRINVQNKESSSVPNSSPEYVLFEIEPDLQAENEDEKENIVKKESLDYSEFDPLNLKQNSEGESTNLYKCLECYKTFSNKSFYTRHKISHSVTSQNFNCDMCEKQFLSELALQKHKKRHRNKDVRSSEDDPFSKWYVFADGQKHLKCDQCKYNSLWYHKGRFLEHYRIHTGEKPFQCGQCSKQFRTKTLLQKHVMYVHEGIKEHPCDICGRCFSDKRYMEDHRRIHTGERPYVCDLCGKTFKQSASLFIHKELHKGLRKHACHLCTKRFTTRSSLNIHIKRHVGERNFICAVCGKAFVDSKHLKDHMAVHSDERPFQCDLCHSKFKLLKHLKQHGRTHMRDNVLNITC